MPTFYSAYYGTMGVYQRHGENTTEYTKNNTLIKKVRAAFKLVTSDSAVRVFDLKIYFASIPGLSLWSRENTSFKENSCFDSVSSRQGANYFSKR